MMRWLTFAEPVALRFGRRASAASGTSSAREWCLTPFIAKREIAWLAARLIGDDSLRRRLEDTIETTVPAEDGSFTIMCPIGEIQLTSADVRLSLDDISDQKLKAVAWSYVIKDIDPSVLYYWAA